jgi:hypothetical protein
MNKVSKLRKDVFILRDALFAWMEYAELAADENTDETMLDRYFREAIQATMTAQGSRPIAEFLGGKDVDVVEPGTVTCNDDIRAYADEFMFLSNTEGYLSGLVVHLLDELEDRNWKFDPKDF